MYNKSLRYGCILITLVLIAGNGSIAASSLIWDENFNDNRYNWYDDGSRMKIADGRYEFYSEANDAYSWRSTPFRNGVIEVDTQWLKGRDTHGYGIIFRLLDADHFYFFWIAAQGYYVLGKAESGTVTLLQSWTYSPVVVPHGKNTLRVDMKETVFTGYVNGTKIFEVEDTSYSEGGFGFYSQQNIAASFDNLKVWEGSFLQQSIPTKGLVGHWGGMEDLIGLNDICLQGGAQGDDEQISLIANRSQWALLDPSMYQLYDGYTISFDVRFKSWANDGSHADNQYLLEWTDDADYGSRSYIMRLQILGEYDYASSSHELAAGIGRASQYFKTGVTPSLNTWYRLTLVLDKQQLRLYLDDEKILDTPFTGKVPESSSKDIAFGRHFHSSAAIGYYSDVDIGHIFLYDRPLSSDEVSALINGTSKDKTEESIEQVQTPIQSQIPQATRIPEMLTVFGEYNARGSFGGSVYLKDIFNKEAYPVYLAFFPLTRTGAVDSSTNLDDYAVKGSTVYYTATNSNGFYHLDLAEGAYYAAVYDARGYRWKLIQGDSVITVTRTMKVHHYKIDNTQDPAIQQNSYHIAVKGTVLEGSQTVAGIPVKAYSVTSLDEMTVAFIQETITDSQGNFILQLPIDGIYILKAGVSEEEWQAGIGKHGGTVVDLALPMKDSVTILLEQR